MKPHNAIQQGSLLDMPALERKEVKPSQPVTEKKMSRLEELIAELCPNGVEYKSIDSFCEISRGKVISKDYIRDNAGRYPVYSSQTENEGVLGRISTYMYDGEYLTWTTDGANAGSVFYRLGKFSVTNVCGLLKITDKNISTKYIYYALGYRAKDYVNSGMGNPKLMSNMVAKIKIPVPPLPIQEEIVRILDKFAELTAELTKRKQQYQYYRDELFKNSISSKSYKLMDLCGTITTGRLNANAMVENGKYPFFTCDANPYKIDTYAFDTTAILISGNGSQIGHLNFYSGKFNAYQRTYVLYDFFKVSPRYLFLYLKSYVREYILKYAKKGSVPYITLPMLQNFLVPVPPLEEQERIVAILDRFDALCNDLTSGLPAEIEARKKQYEYYRDKLLTFKEAV